MSHRLNRQDDVAWIQGDHLTTCSHTRRINPMGFVIPLLDTIKLGAATCTDFNGEICQLEPLKQGPSCRIHGRSILERLFCFGLNVWMSELGGGLISLFLIAGVARERQVAHAT